MKIIIRTPIGKFIDLDTHNKDVEITTCISKCYYYSIGRNGRLKYKSCYDVYIVYDGNDYRIASFNYKLPALIYKYRILRDIKRAVK